MTKSILGAIAAAATVAALTSTPAAQALPGECFDTPFGGYCDTDPWPDGSFQHCEKAFGFTNCFRACHDPSNGGRTPTDADVNTPC
ncbi:hypothetical protein [Mycolicibacterium brumae]|uniref:Secreted protein n=1 Tax=Mycolicibacterium brumae TaxID=85968 RepID=A0A2G5P461_9MYCO|nr:hypothetical protein [Mycolicibacterium brumae]MCV7191295.1 hypothetical protein [Mycolicibacterium brumae]PIB73086.1 hypothetical protein CQY22_018380 [Mycolicibacterium brumae]RWA16926.1 hypothetical protein MBRU_19020 [Mycolicibacterium brumae DSM 44177]UWW08294.1 hypothetical protein L2Z93_001344 [Mycolicibacterium brumae]